MSDIRLSKEFECLGIGPTAGLLEVRRAYLQTKTLYEEDSLATYALLDEEERRAKLESIEEAYRRISRVMSPPPPAVVPLRGEPEIVGEETEPDGEAALSVDPQQSPGLFLKRFREQAGISLREIADRTKIGSMKLECIETERFDRLPAPVYLRGFVDQYARAVGLANPEEIAALYLERVGKSTGGA